MFDGAKLARPLCGSRALVNRDFIDAHYKKFIASFFLVKPSHENDHSSAHGLCTPFLISLFCIADNKSKSVYQFNSRVTADDAFSVF